MQNDTNAPDVGNKDGLAGGDVPYTRGPLVVDEILNMPGITHGVREVDEVRMAGGFWTAYIPTDLVDGTSEGNANLYAAAPNTLDYLQRALSEFRSELAQGDGATDEQAALIHNAEAHVRGIYAGELPKTASAESLLMLNALREADAALEAAVAIIAKYAKKADWKGSSPRKGLEIVRATLAKVEPSNNHVVGEA